MKYSDYKIIVEKEYRINRKNLPTTYVFLIMALFFYLTFFFYIQESMILVAAFFLNIVSAIYLIRSIKSMHPYWEIRIALDAKRKDDDISVYKFAAVIDYVVEHKFSPFKEKSKKIFEESYNSIIESNQISDQAKIQLKMSLSAIK